MRPVGDVHMLIVYVAAQPEPANPAGNNSCSYRQSDETWPLGIEWSAEYWREARVPAADYPQCQRMGVGCGKYFRVASKTVHSGAPVDLSVYLLSASAVSFGNASEFGGHDRSHLFEGHEASGRRRQTRPEGRQSGRHQTTMTLHLTEGRRGVTARWTPPGAPAGEVVGALCGRLSWLSTVGDRPGDESNLCSPAR
jgi:hypothetical protein